MNLSECTVIGYPFHKIISVVIYFSAKCILPYLLVPKPILVPKIFHFRKVTTSKKVIPSCFCSLLLNDVRLLDFVFKSG